MTSVATPLVFPSGHTRQKVMFLFASAQRSLGSRALRCDQLCQIGQQYLGHRFDFSVHELKRGRPRLQRQLAKSAAGAIIIFLKHAAKKMDERAREILRKRAGGICIDYIDMPFLPESGAFYDTHIFASETWFRLMSARFQRHGEQMLRDGSIKKGAIVAKLTHGPDLRASYSPDSADGFRIGYLGLKENLELPPSVASEVHCLPYTPKSDMLSLFSEFASFPMQYAVRPPPPNGMLSKPFTKGMIAAAMGRNILVNRQVTDAEYYLGDDYPFLIDDLEVETIRGGIEKARQLYLTPEWERGLDAMKRLREASKPASIASELLAILERFQ